MANFILSPDLFSSNKYNKTSMAYSGRKRYVSRRERLENGIRNWKLGILFAFMALIVWMIKERVALIDWVETFFY